MNLKREAAQKALEYIQNGMTLGLGSGSTTAYFIDMLGDKIRAGMLRDIKGVPTSDETAKHARALEIPLTTLSKHPLLDLAVDGADEVDPDFNLIKGLGRAALREKIVEMHARRLMVIVDESKLVRKLGTHVPLPVEIVQFEAEMQIRWLNSLGCKAEQWLEDDGTPVVTDNGNYLVRCSFEGGIDDVQALSTTLSLRPGVIGHGLFLNMADIVIVAGDNGIRILEK